MSSERERRENRRITNLVATACLVQEKHLNSNAWTKKKQYKLDFCHQVKHEYMIEYKGRCVYLT